MNATQVVLIPLDMIDVDPNNPRGNITDRAEVKDLLLSIKQVGLLNPVLVKRQTSEGRYPLVAGERRLSAYRFLQAEGRAEGQDNTGFDAIPTIVCEFEDDLKVFQAQLAENEARVDVALVNKSISTKRIAEQNHLDQTQVAALLNKSQDYVSKLFSIAGADEDTQAVLAGHKVSLDDAVLLVRISAAVPTQRKQKVLQSLAEKRSNGAMSREELRKYLAKCRRGPVLEKRSELPAVFEQKGNNAKLKATSWSRDLAAKPEVCERFVQDFEQFIGWLDSVQSPLADMLERLIRARASSDHPGVGAGANLGA